MHTAFECIFFNDGDDNTENALETWTREIAPPIQSDDEKTKKKVKKKIEIQEEDNGIPVVFQTINGDVSILRRTLRLCQDSKIFCDIVKRSEECSHSKILRVDNLNDVAYETVKMMFDYVEKPKMRLNKLSAKKIFPVATKCDLRHLKRQCEITLTKNLTLDSAMELLNLALHDSAFMEGAYDGMHLARRCSSVIVKNFIKAPEISGSGEMWNTSIDFVLRELRRRLSHPKSVLKWTKGQV